MDMDAFRRRALSGGAITGGVTRTAPGQPKAASDGSRTISFVFSDESVDLECDVIRASGWDVATYKRNPTVLFGHDPSRPEYVIGRAVSVAVEGNALMGTVAFADRETNVTADTVYRLYLGGFLNAVSVGFEPIDFEFSADKARPGGIDFNRQKLLEVSAVPIPCNSNALAVARGKGIDTSPIVRWADHALDTGALPMKREIIEAVRKQAGAPTSYRARSTPGRGETVEQSAARHGIILRNRASTQRSAPTDWHEALKNDYSNDQLWGFIKAGTLPDPIKLGLAAVQARYGTPLAVELRRRGLMFW